MIVPRGMVNRGWVLQWGKYIPEGGKAVLQAPEVTELSHRTPAWLEGSPTLISLQPLPWVGNLQRNWIICQVLFHIMSEGDMLEKSNLSTCSSKYCCFWSLSTVTKFKWGLIPFPPTSSSHDYTGKNFWAENSIFAQSNVQHGCVTGRPESLQLFLVYKEYIQQNIYRF